MTQTAALPEPQEPDDAASAALDAALEVALAQPGLQAVPADPAAAAGALVDEIAVAVALDLAPTGVEIGGLSAVEQRRVGFYAASTKAAATRQAYLGAWRGFALWCGHTGRVALPASPQTVAAFLSYLADTGASLPTVVRHRAAIRHAHVLAPRCRPGTPRSPRSPRSPR